jgi:hypothetical protein
VRTRAVATIPEQIALPVADPELGGGAPPGTDRIMCDQRMLAGGAKIRGSDVDVNERARGRVHVESVMLVGRGSGRLRLAVADEAAQLNDAGHAQDGCEQDAADGDDQQRHGQRSLDFRPQK